MNDDELIAEAYSAVQKQPTKMHVDSNGTKRWYNRAGQFHKDGAPTVIYPTGNTEWIVNGEHHREDGPAVTYKGSTGGFEEYWINGKMYDTYDEFKKAVDVLRRKHFADTHPDIEEVMP
jgi:hypothetical protein